MQLHIQTATIHISSSLGLDLLQLPVQVAAVDVTAGATPTSGGDTLCSSTAQPTLTPPAIGEHWAGQGGIYVGVLPAIGDRPAMHMIVSVEETKAKWGPYDDEVTGAASRHNGRANTAALMATNFDTATAARWCYDLRAGDFIDWHLPSQAELFMASLHAPQVFQKEGWYWSSTQTSRYNAFAQYFEYGHSYWHGKDSELRVRAFRWIPFTA